jgi:hypothetical protein
MGWVQAGEGYRPCRRSRGASSQGTPAARRAIESVVAAVFEVDPRELQARSRGSARTVFARQVAMYLAHVACGISLADVGVLFGATAPPCLMLAAWWRTRGTIPTSIAGWNISSTPFPAWWTPCRCVGSGDEQRTGEAEGRQGGCPALLQRLTDQDVTLRRVEGCYRLMGQSTQQAARVPESLISLCTLRDWLKRDGQDLVLSDAGRAWLRRDGDSADPFLQQHQIRATGLRDVEGARRQVTANETESPLGWLRSRKDRNGRPLITDAQYVAGERLRADYWSPGSASGSRRTGRPPRRPTGHSVRPRLMPLPCATTSSPRKNGWRER